MEKENATFVIDTKTYNRICNDVFDYMLSFNSDDEVVDKNFNVKRNHINKVVGYAEVIGRNLALDQDQVYTVELAALLHDVGRFEQFSQYETFDDAKSEDHADMAISIIKEKNWLIELPDEIQESILQAVKYHNKISLPKNMNDDIELIAKIVRDADKLDIVEALIKEYNLPEKQRNTRLTYELANNSLVSAKVVKAILAEKLPDKKDLKTVSDFKLMQMAFVFDINFPTTFSLFNKKQYLKRIFDTLPKSDMVFDVYRKTKIHIENHLL